MALSLKAKEAIRRAVTDDKAADELIAKLEEASDSRLDDLEARMDAEEAATADHEARIAALEAL